MAEKVSHFKDHRIIVTGACGVVGQALSNRLVAQGAFVIGIARKETREVSCPLIMGDLLDRAFVMKAFKEAHLSDPITTVFHLAGLSDANLCEADPFLAFQMNASMTLNILEAMVKNDIHHLIYPSSAYVYGTNYQQDIKEDSKVIPSGEYAATKLTAEDMIRGCCAYGKLDCDILRIVNIYGPHLKPNTVIGSLVAQSDKGDKIVLQNLAPVRDFIYIDDVVEAMVRLILTRKKGCHLYNLSMGKGVSVGEMAKVFCEVKGIAPDSIQSLPASDQKLSRLVLDNQALYQRLQWRPQIDLKEGFKKILEARFGVSKK